MSYQFKASETFWRNFYRLPDRQKEAVRRAWKIFKANPFDPRLGVHKIHALRRRPRADRPRWRGRGWFSLIWRIEANTVFTVDIGTHAIYGT